MVRDLSDGHNPYVMGFTLIELLIVITIIAILSSLALPAFYSTKERALGKEAIVNLKLIAAAERIYRMEQGTYYPASGSETNINNINTNLKLSIIETIWDYSVTTTNATPPTFSISARRLTGSCVYTLTNTDADGEPHPNASCP